MLEFTRRAVRRIDPYRSAEVVEDKLASLHRRLRGQRAARRRALTASLAAAVAVSAFALILVGRSPLTRGEDERTAPSPIHKTADAARAAAAPQLALADGSSVQSERDASVVVVDASAGHVLLRFDRGRARFTATPAPRPFTVDSGVVHLVAYAAEFVASREGAGATVEVIAGEVQVEWPQGTQVLTAGMRGSFPKPPAPAEQPVPTPTRPTPAPRQLSRGPQDRPAPAATAATAMERADTARREGHLEEAIALLRHVAASEDPQRAIAGFTLGKLLSQTGKPADAADAFAAARAQGLGALEEDAWVREIAERRAAGQGARADELMRTYLQRFPDGRRRHEVDPRSPR